jgi:peptidoglycan hydrolase-like protein with peptidoglycan-binding domain
VPATPDVVTGVGSRGSKVVIIQRVVQASAEGVYGPNTAAAVKVWQRSHGLPATGVVDSLTWSKIKAVWAASTPAVGNDISWPQCPKGTGIPSRRGQGQPMPPASAEFVVIGLTNGPAFYPNPCLATQTAWAKAHHVYTSTYAMTTYPTSLQLATYGSKGPYTGTSSAAKLANTGYAQAQFNVASMRTAGLVSPFMWVDVEPYPVAPWSLSTTANKSVVDGALRGYRAAGFRVGLYSTASAWPHVLGSARYGLPEWRTAGPRAKRVALGRCASSQSFQGGPAVLAQWWTPTTDHDLTCPVVNTRSVPTAYFHKY